MPPKKIIKGHIKSPPVKEETLIDTLQAEKDAANERAKDSAAIRAAKAREEHEILSLEEARKKGLVTVTPVGGDVLEERPDSSAITGKVTGIKSMSPEEFEKHRDSLWAELKKGIADGTIPIDGSSPVPKVEPPPKKPISVKPIPPIKVRVNLLNYCREMGMILIGRRLGNTSRQVDAAINLLFNGNIVDVEDHYKTKEASERLFAKILSRIDIEHRIKSTETELIYQNKSELRIQLNIDNLKEVGIMLPDEPLPKAHDLATTKHGSWSSSFINSITEKSIADSMVTKIDDLMLKKIKQAEPGTAPFKRKGAPVVEAFKKIFKKW